MLGLLSNRHDGVLKTTKYAMISTSNSGGLYQYYIHVASSEQATFRADLKSIRTWTHVGHAGSITNGAYVCTDPCDNKIY